MSDSSPRKGPKNKFYYFSKYFQVSIHPLLVKRYIVVVYTYIAKHSLIYRTLARVLLHVKYVPDITSFCVMYAFYVFTFLG